MSAYGPALLVSSAFLHAAWNALMKRDSRPEISSVLVWVSVCLIVSAWVWVGGIQWGTSREAWWWAAAAGFFEAIYFRSLGMALARGPLGLVYSVSRGGAMLLVWLASTIFLGEAVRPLQWLGMIFILAGILLLFLKRNELDVSPGARRWAISAACGIAGYHLCYAKALSHGLAPVSLFAMAMWVASPLLLLTLEKTAWPILLEKMKVKKQIGLFLFAGFICFASFVIFLRGLAETSPGVGISLRNTSLIFAQLFAFFLGERLTRRQWSGVGFIVVGAWAVS